MTSTLFRLVRRLTALAAVAVAVTAAVFAGEAKALNPNQTSVKTIVNTVYWDLDSYWIPRTPASVGYFDYWLNGSLIDYATPCVTTSTQHGTEGFYCRPNQRSTSTTTSRLATSIPSATDRRPSGRRTSMGTMSRTCWGSPGGRIRPTRSFWPTASPGCTSTTAST
jgi:hypothetical protein